MKLLVSTSILAIVGVYRSDGFQATSIGGFRKRQSTACFSSIFDEDGPTNPSTLHRRSFVGGIVGGLSVLVSIPPSAFARDELFRSNPLTNPVLEQIRIWEQAEADQIKYKGELEMGDAGNKGQVGAYPRLLVPILKINQELVEVKTLVHATDNAKEAWSKALSILKQPTYDKITFKKTFNKYGDNIYYSDPDRANAYLGGGATPKVEQSLAYLLRNDILTNVENLRAELEYLLKTGETETEDLYSYSDIAVSAMEKYLAIVPPNELSEAQRMLDSGEKV